MRAPVQSRIASLNKKLFGDGFQVPRVHRAILRSVCRMTSSRTGGVGCGLRMKETAAMVMAPKGTAQNRVSPRSQFRRDAGRLAGESRQVWSERSERDNDSRLIQKQILHPPYPRSVKAPPRSGPTTDETAKTAPNKLQHEMSEPNRC